MRGGKILILISALIAMSASVFAQTPLGFNYQGVARSADGSPLINQFIGLRVSITSGPSGSIDYIEDHHPETNEFGLFNIIVGQGQSSGNIADVNWGEGNKWLQIEIDPEDNANYILVGSQQMMSVPYSLYAAKSGEALNAGIGIDISNGQINNVLPDQTVALIGSGAATVTGTYPNFEVDVANIDDADADPTNELQDISTSGVAGNISLSDGSEITLNVDDADADSINEIQTLESVLMVGADAGGEAITNLADPTNAQDAATKNYIDTQDLLDLDKDATNEIQSLAGVLSEGADAGAVAITNLAEPTNAQDAATKNYIDTQDLLDLDKDVTNEIQSLAGVLSEGADAGAVAITNLADPTNAQEAATKNYVDAQDLLDLDKDATNEIQDISTSGAAGNISLSDGSAISLNVDDADASPINEIQTLTDVLTEGANAGALAITNLADPTVAQDAATKSYVDTQNATLAVTITSNTNDISTEVADRQTGDTALQSELDLTQTGSGLNADGTFTADPTTTYLQAATGLKQSDKLLDTRLATNTGTISVNSGAITTESTARTNADGLIQTELDATQTGAGLEADGTYIADGTTTYLGAASDLKSADRILDTEIVNNSTNITSLNSRLDNTNAFQAEFNIYEPAGVIKTAVPLNELIDSFGQIDLNEITINSTGLYMIVIDAERTNSDNNFELLYIRINGVDSTIGLGGQGQNFNRTQILSLTSGDKISLLATATDAMSLPVTGLISGYKISD